MSDFPLIKRLGLEVHLERLPTMTDMRTGEPVAWRDIHVVDAEPLERLLASAPVVYGYKDGELICWMKRIGRDINPTHEALAVGIRPIERDTAEGLLRELVEIIKEVYQVSYKEDGFVPAGKGVFDLADRARALLEALAKDGGKGAVDEKD